MQRAEQYPDDRAPHRTAEGTRLHQGALGIRATRQLNMGEPEAEDEVEAAGELAIATTSGDPSARPTNSTARAGVRTKTSGTFACPEYANGGRVCRQLGRCRKIGYWKSSQNREQRSLRETRLGSRGRVLEIFAASGHRSANMTASTAARWRSPTTGAWSRERRFRPGRRRSSPSNVTRYFF